jgi:hypothetical protein
MDCDSLRSIASRCIGVAQKCSDAEAQAKLYDLAKELLHKANELDGALDPRSKGHIQWRQEGRP